MNDTDYRKAARVAARLNMIPNLVWSALFLVPACYFCYRYLSPQMVLLLLVISLVPAFLPHTFFDRLQISTKSRWYRRMGVQYINKVTQNGRLVSDALKKQYPGYKGVYRSRASIRKQYAQTYFFEKFHFCLFVFFTLLTLQALAVACYGWAMILTISNIAYNIYPNLLQQYIRVKLRAGIGEKGSA